MRAVSPDHVPLFSERVASQASEPRVYVPLGEWMEEAVVGAASPGEIVIRAGQRRIRLDAEGNAVGSPLFRRGG